MKTLQELYDEVVASEELKTEFLECAKTKEGAAEFLKKYDCAASVDELKAFLNEIMIAKSGELNEEELKQIAGGTSKPSKTTADLLVTILAFGGCITQSLVVGKFDDEDCLLSDY